MQAQHTERNFYKYDHSRGKDVLGDWTKLHKVNPVLKILHIYIYIQILDETNRKESRYQLHNTQEAPSNVTRPPMS